MARSQLLLSLSFAALPLFFTSCAVPPTAGAVGELPVRRIPHQGTAAEGYFSPDGRQMVCNAKLDGDDEYQVYTIDVASGAAHRINDAGADACSFYYPDGQRLIWTSTKDHPDLPRGNFSESQNYPQGAELYSSALDGSDVQRLTNNLHYDAEVSVSPDGRWILFARQIDGHIDLWRMHADGSGEQQITHTPDEQEGGAFYMPDSETLIYRSWSMADEGKSPTPMEIYTMRQDGTGKRQITSDGQTNWAPFPAPDGEHIVFDRVLPPHNFEIFLMSLVTGKQTRLTYDDGFDGFPVLSPDGRTLAFASGRDAAPGARTLALYTMDISSLGLGAGDGR